MATVTGAFMPHPAGVISKLKLADFRYPAGRLDVGFSHFPAIPSLFALMTRLRRFPRPDEALRFLMEHADEGTEGDPQTLKRAQKLYLDFGRDMHTLGLLYPSGAFEFVEYQKALDLQYNVDFVAGLLPFFFLLDEAPDPIGIQAAMRHPGLWRGSNNSLREMRHYFRYQAHYSSFAREPAPANVIHSLQISIARRYGEGAAERVAQAVFGIASLREATKAQAMVMQNEIASNSRWGEVVEAVLQSEPGGARCDPYEARKKLRRVRRGAEEWSGRLYWMTNRDRPYATSVAGCWLFGSEHVNDLIEELRADFEPDGVIGIQTATDEPDVPTWS